MSDPKFLAWWNAWRPGSKYEESAFTAAQDAFAAGIASQQAETQRFRRALQGVIEGVMTLYGDVPFLRRYSGELDSKDT